MKKYITFVVPCYNSESYMRHCIDTLLPGGTDIEILIVDDGSGDRTGEIADAYQNEYPDIVRAIHKENGGHGSGVNVGIEQAQGEFLKVVDSDDWVDQEAYAEYLSVIKNHVDQRIEVDVYFTNFVYENTVKNSVYVLDYRRQFPQRIVFRWEQIRDFRTGEFLMMHSLTFRVEVLRNSKVHLLEHTFYVDNIFCYQPLAYCKKLYYLPVNLYRYFIGRSDQSVNIDNMVSRYDQQLRVIDYISTLYTRDFLKSLGRKQYKYMIHHLGILSFLTMVFIYGKYDEEKGKAYNAYLKHFKEENPDLYKQIRWKSQVVIPFLLIPPLRRRAVMAGYRIVCRITKWG